MKKTTALVLALIGCGGHNNGPQPEPDPSYVPNDADATTLDSTTDAGILANSGADGSSTPRTDIGQTDVGCGGQQSPKCDEGKKCVVDSDCTVACNYTGTCVSAPSCRHHFGGDTCGKGEVGYASTHESCCRTLLVSGYVDSSRPDKKVYLDKYEITAGRVREFIQEVTKQMGGKPDVKGWAQANRPFIWNDSWSEFLPSDVDGGLVTINRLLLGDPRHDGQTAEQAGPGVILPPPTDQTVSVGLNHQFGGQVYADVHGNNCGTFAGSYGFPTYYYSPAIQSKNGEAARTNPIGFKGESIPVQEALDVKSMNCITNAMLAAFCHWDGGQLATAEVMDYVTDSPGYDDSVSGCGIQYDNHADLLGAFLGRTVQTGGRCAPVINVNATFDAGDNLPTPGSFLNQHNYHYPDFGNSTSDKSWQVAAPGRMLADTVRINQADEPWMDLAGNLSESVLEPKTGRFGLKHRGIGYGSSRSDLNVTLMPGESILRVQRPEVKTALVGGRCIRFK